MSAELLFSPFIFMHNEILQSMRKDNVVLLNSLFDRMADARVALRSFSDTLWSKHVVQVLVMRVVLDAYGNFHVLLRVDTISGKVNEEKILSDYSVLCLFNFDGEGNCEITEENYDDTLNLYMEVDDLTLQTQGILIFQTKQ